MKLDFHNDEKHVADKEHTTGDMSMIDLVSKNLLAKFFRNCCKRNN